MYYIEKLATEAIDFQHDGFAQKLIAVIASEREIFRKARGGKAAGEVLGRALCDVLTERFKIKLKPTMVEGAYAFGIVPPIMDKNHVFYSDRYIRQMWQDFDPPIFRKNVDKILSYKYNGVDLAKATVSGGFSEIECELFMSLDEMYEHLLTDEEIAAILLHESGHAFTFLEYLGKVTAMNQILALVYEENFVTVPQKSKEYMIEQFKGKKDPILLEAMDSKSPAERATVLMKSFLVEPSTVSLSGHYDQTAAEALADNFAARFGLARALTTALDKISRNDPDYVRNRSSTIVMSMVGTAIFVLTVGAIAIVAPILAALYGGVLLSLVLMSSGESSRDYTYDRLRVRYLRIREQLVQELKQRKNKETRRILSDIIIIDRVTADMRHYDGPLDQIFNAIFSKNKDAIKSAEIQRQLEELASNDLYIKAAQLKTLAA